MTHEVLNSVLAVQQTNATLSGRELRAAAENVTHLATGRTFLKALDAVGERIIGAALLLDESLQNWDYTGAFPANATCLLVGGAVAGPVGITTAAQDAAAAGASRVEVAVLNGWSNPLPGVSRVRRIGHTPVQVA